MNNNQKKALAVSVSFMILSFLFHFYDVRDFGEIMVVTRRYIAEQIGIVVFLGLCAVYFLRTKKDKMK